MGSTLSVPSGARTAVFTPSPHAVRTPASAMHRPDALQVSQVVYELAPDELRPLSHWAEVWGLERKGLAHQAARAGVPIVKIGRERCARRSDLLAMVDALAAKGEPKKPAGAPTYAELVSAAGAKR